MYSFRWYITEAVRTGLPTPGNDSGNPMDHKQLHALIKTGKVHLGDVTEKTDGSVFHIGHDEHGFWSQYSGSGSEKMRSKQDYIDRAKRRAVETGKEYNPTVAEGFGKFHEALSNHKRLQQHLRDEYKKTGQPVHIKGEAFNRFMGDSHDDGKKHQWAATSYDTDTMGKHGSFIIHSKLPGNESHAHAIHHLKGPDESGVHIDDDKIEHKPTSVDVSDEAKKLSGLNHELLNSRTTKTNKEAKEAEKAKVSEIGNSVQDKINKSVLKQNIKPKWSKEGNSEGFVVHPHGDQPRFKVLSPKFIATKSSDEYKTKWADKKGK